MSTVTPLTVIQGQYLTPIAEVDAHREAHLAFMAGLVAGGRVVMAGRRTPADGSIIVFRGADADAALRVLEEDPYVAAGVVAHAAVGVFTPGTHASELAAALTTAG
jgi:uncharacterized protein YciI